MFAELIKISSSKYKKCEYDLSLYFFLSKSKQYHGSKCGSGIFLIWIMLIFFCLIFIFFFNKLLSLLLISLVIIEIFFENL